MATSTAHQHAHHGILGKNTELYFALLCGFFLVVGFLLERLTEIPTSVWKTVYVFAYLFGGYFVSLEAVKKIPKGEFDIDFLMIAAALGAMYIDSWAEGALLLFLFSLGHALEHYAMHKAKKSIEALGNLSPKTALVKRNATLHEIPIEDLQINDVIVVKPNTKIAADGVIITGHSSVNQAPITGESIPVDKVEIPSTENLPAFSEIDKKHTVFAGTINGDHSIEVQVLKLSKDSTVARLIDMVSEVETQKSPTQRLTKKFEKWYVPIVLIVVFLLCFGYLVINETFDESLYRAITVLVAASPCALAISTPSAVLSGIARAAQKGVLIKGGKALEDLGSIKAIAFDKTGTLTEGKPSLKNIIPLHDFDEQKLAELVLEVESLSNHPLAKAIAKDIQKRYQLEATDKATDVEAIQGKGITAMYQNDKICIGNVVMMESEGIPVDDSIHTSMKTLLQKGETVMLVAFQSQLIGMISVMDIPRKTAKSTIERLREIGVKFMVMLTGDHQHVGDAIAQQIGLSEARGNLLPEAKVTEIEKLLQSHKKVAMVGDGVNDAPAMALSTVSVAMGAAGSDVTLEVADVALMSDKIENLPFVFGLSNASKKIIKQNIYISLGMVFFLVPITILGLTNIGVAVLLHEGSTIVVVLNALRLLRYEAS
ncbi:Cd2+/Zn2+-exporting ATPase [Kordia periserrulae]|uniref:P-type Zn(2+) transporter n=1 Tax=Kordia periserrulae TaxID=701523 RepID=A0A2T6C1S5_9FLAO|nr:heavy metal translocating P-type ATPase [Kordia periserrulae]PTX62274.1 Cd2+/Zn2+-exporting ATPase [Kordia periserrulae]